jgi:hypothetical protein
VRRTPDGWFGFIFWGMAYLTLYPGATRWAGPWRSAETLLNYFWIAFGLYVLIAGTYVRAFLPSIPFFFYRRRYLSVDHQTSIKSIIIDYTGQKPFSCVRPRDARSNTGQ